MAACSDLLVAAWFFELDADLELLEVLSLVAIFTLEVFVVVVAVLRDVDGVEVPVNDEIAVLLLTPTLVVGTALLLAGGGV